MNKIPLMQGSTPFYKAQRMSAELGFSVYFKRDDLSPLGLGGNKIRKLEYLLADAKAKGHGTVVTTAAAQSNFLRIFTACCNRLGLRPVVFARGNGGEPLTGNLLCTKLLGAEIHFVDTEDPFSERMLEAMRQYDSGAYIIHLGLFSGPIATLGYIDAMRELAAQCKELDIAPKAIYTAVGSGGTYAGLWMGARLYLPMEVVGVSVNLSRDALGGVVSSHIREASALWGAPMEAKDGEILIHDDLLFPGYGKLNAQCMDALMLVARWEGVLLDPIYTAKPAAALLRDASKYKPSDSVVLLHSGGSPNLFGHAQEIASYLG